MKKLILLSFVLFFTINAKAQTFATPNSQWYYSRIALLGPSYAQITVGGTVTIASKICRQLNYINQTFNYPNGPINTTSIIPYRYIYENNKVVYLYNPNTTNFDTLCNYNAAIGSKWLLPAIYTNTFLSTCNRTLLTVIDTGRSTIQGISLKWIKSNVDTIYERIGFLTQYFFQYDNCTTAYDYNEGGGLRCFSDNQILNYNRTNNTCSYLYTTTSLNKQPLNNYLKIYPNPANEILNVDFVTLSRLDATYKIEIINALGQVIKEEEITFKDNKATISTKELANGVYVLTLLDTPPSSATRSDKNFVSKRFVVAR